MRKRAKVYVNLRDDESCISAELRINRRVLERLLDAGIPEGAIAAALRKKEVAEYVLAKKNRDEFSVFVEVRGMDIKFVFVGEINAYEDDLEIVVHTLYTDAERALVDAAEVVATFSVN